MSRAHFIDDLVNRATGARLQGATVVVVDHDSGDPLSTIYGSPTSSTPISNPIVTGPLGTVDIWLPSAQRVDLEISYPGAEDRTVTIDVPPAPDDIVTLAETQVLHSKTMVDSLWSGGMVQDAVWDGGAINNALIEGASISGAAIDGGTWINAVISTPTINGPVINGPSINSPAIGGATFTTGAGWPNGYAGPTLQSLEHALANPLGVVGGDSSLGTAVQRGATGLAVSANVPYINEQFVINPSGYPGGTGNVFYRLVKRVGSGNLWALYANLFHLLAQGTTTAMAGGSDNVTLAAIAENVAGGPQRIWAFYPEIRAWSAVTSALGIENDAWNGTGVRAARPWRLGAENPYISNNWAIADADSLGVDGSKYVSAAYTIIGRHTHVGVPAMRGSYYVGLMANGDSIRHSGSDVGMTTRVAPTVLHPEGEAVAWDPAYETVDDSGGYLIHGALLHESSRFGLMQHGGALWAAQDGWDPSSNYHYSTDIPLIGTEAGTNYNYLYGQGGAIYFVPSRAPSRAWAFMTATELALASDLALAWGNNTSIGAIDLRLERLAANHLSLVRDDTAGPTHQPQTFSIANFRNGGGYERGELHWAGDQFIIEAGYGGSGVARPISFATGAAIQWQVLTTGILATANGRRLHAHQPSVRAYKNATQTIPNVTETLVTFDVESYDQTGDSAVTGMHAPGGASFVAPITGIYRWAVKLTGAGLAGGTLRQLVVYGAGVPIWIDEKPPNASIALHFQGSGEIALNTGESVEFHFYHDAGGAGLDLVPAGVYGCSASLTLASN